MINNEDYNKIKKTKLLLNLAWLGMLLMSFFYLYLTVDTPKSVDPITLELFLGNSVNLIYLAIGTVSVLCGVFISKQLYSNLSFFENKFAKMFLSVRGRVDNVIELKDRNIKINLSSVIQGGVISMGMTHIFAVYGLIVNNKNVSHLFFILSFIGMLFTRPRIKKLLEL